MKSFLVMGLSLALVGGTVVPAGAEGLAEGLALYGGRDARLEVASAAEGALTLAQGGGGRPLRISGSGQTVMVAADYSFGSDITALFRPKRWRHPLVPGGVVSWLNPYAWGDEPYRTTTVLVGELLFFGVSYGIYELLDNSSSGDSYQPPPESASEPPPPSPPASSGGGGGGGGRGGSAGSTPPPPTGGGGGTPPPSSGGGGFESPF